MTDTIMVWRERNRFGTPHMINFLMLPVGPGDLMPVVPDLPDQKEAEDKQVATAPRVPAAAILRDQARTGSRTRAAHDSTGAQEGQQHDTV